MNSQILKQLQDPNILMTQIDFTIDNNQIETVTTIACSPHPKQQINLSDALQQFKDFKKIKCPFCNGIANNINELVKSINWIAKEQFHKSVTSISIIEGLMINKYIRTNRYLSLLNETNQLFKDLLLRSQLDYNNQKESQIKSILRLCPTNNVEIFCGLDKVRMNIPVRIVKCEKHIQCYELTSLLILIKEKQQQQVVTFKCDYCQSEYNWSEYTDLYSMIIIDLELIQAIKKSVPFSQQLKYISQTKELLDYSIQSEGQTIDSQINAFYQLNKDKIDKLTDQQLYDVVIQSASICTNGPANTQIMNKIKNNLNLVKFQSFNINLIDRLTKQIIEYPARCVNCTDFTQCIDLRSLICDYQMVKLKGQVFYSCAICKSKIDTSKIISNQFYIDYNLLQKFYELYGQNGLQQFQMTNFSYDGKQYMLDEFRNKQKIKYQDYIKAYNEENKLQADNQIAKFTSFKCSIENIPLINPLIIKTCNTIIEFETFYQWFNANKLSINSLANICKCTVCSQTSKPIFQNIYYHEALGMALQANVNKQRQKGFSFNFEKKNISGYDLTQSQIIQNKDKVVNNIINPSQGFAEILSDEYYQEFFSQKTLIGSDNKQYLFKVEKMQQEFGNSIVEFNQNQIKENFAGDVVEMNKQILQNDELRKYQFKFETVEYKVNGDIFKVSKETNQNE